MTRKTEWDVAVVGGANTDHLGHGAALPRPGSTVSGDVYQEAPGGKGANQAVEAARLGARVAFVTRIGRDERGDTVMARLEQEGIDTRHVVRDPDAPTGAAVIQVDEHGQKQILYVPGANHRLQEGDVRAASEAIGAARVVLVQLEVPLAALMTAVRLGHEAGCQVVLDPAPPVPLPDELLGMVDVIKPNEDEAEVLTGIQARHRASARTAAQKLLGRGVGAVAVQAGDEGNLLVWHGGECFLPNLPVNSIDETGAGDAFAAALAVQLAEGRSLEEAGPFASAAAALTTTKLGAQAALPRRDEVVQLLRRR